MTEADVAKQILHVARAFDPLWEVEADLTTDSLNVSHPEYGLGFVITRMEIDDNLHLSRATRGFIAIHRMLDRLSQKIASGVVEDLAVTRARHRALPMEAWASPQIVEMHPAIPAITRKRADGHV